ncbi:jmjC domain-containing protein 8 isoform X5 [Protopterus annectens]|uniref:jmjC domain-containing protein 8 isoform X5 n=1 Tax=Protopterus annectens TaxID=7888 RepID=UPI001CFAF151|nr:jmjC domain-containing protein 8 isoform X5 [Protopterus annectens]
MQCFMKFGDSMYGFLFLLIHLVGVENLEHLEDGGGWFSNKYSVTTREEGPCTVEIRDASLTYSEFMRSYAYSKPVIIRGIADNSDFRAFCSKKNLLRWYGDRLVRLSTANTYSYNKVDVPFQEYVEQLMKPQCPEALGSGAGTGVPFHWHGPGYSEVVYGRKRWFLYPPDKNPKFHPNRTTLSWLLDIYPSLSEEQHPIQCTIHPGEVLYFPDRWWHATLNLDTSVFISTFLG